MEIYACTKNVNILVLITTCITYLQILLAK